MMTMGLSFMPPVGPSSAYKTYRIVQPPDIMIPTTCEAIDCDSWRYGWETPVDERTPLGQAQAAYIRTAARRTYRELTSESGLTIFRFDSGQRCFAEHRSRPEIYTRMPGDWRQQTGAAFRHQTAGDWVEDFAEHQDRLADEQQRG